MPMTERPPKTRWASFRRRLEEKRKDRGIDQGEIGQKLYPPLSQQTVSRYEREPERVKTKGPEFAEAFFRAYGFTDDEARTLTAELFSDLTNLLTGRSRTDMVLVTNGMHINVYAAGTGPAWGDEEVLERLYIPGLADRGDDYIGLKATGDSMAPYLFKDDIAIVRRDDGAVKEGDYCAVWLADDGCVVKKFVKELANGALILESLNPQQGQDRYFEAPLGSRVLGPVEFRLTKG